MAQVIAIYGLASLVGGLIAAFVAKWKNRTIDRWVFACVIFPPFFLLLVLLPKSKTGPIRPRHTRKEIEQMREEFLD